ncbi:Glutamate/Leucine/Phenylalanine/Valine dehydrogenase family protein [Theileria parva strain Muguga]|uniref:Glutamate/Leucine/Phenylalanine/Valine dehydrogenase family protein n=1 Tax=Theileria parva strain Muguga TaxID=333668 RepID=UPI001C622AAC|nr:Glutamate/Leucine/Phenylalanine/Valine dehydrogenase family protein [Theileria parva strain Muguga]EAN32237.2 Glutamate/Leucine/Phenylalanine/Valine dehydrogenase family protein [Theileria parva strain Muguga]
MEDVSAYSDRFAINDGLSDVHDEQCNQLLSDRYCVQFSEVSELIRSMKTFSDDKIIEIMHDYYNELGLNEYYFSSSPTALIANNVISVMSAKVLHENSGSNFFPTIEQITEDSAFIIARTSSVNRKSSENYLVEQRVEGKYFNLDDDRKTCWRMQCFRSSGSVFKETEHIFDRLKTYFLQKPKFTVNNPDPGETELANLLDREFYLNKKNTITEQIFHNLNKKLVESKTGLGLAINYEPRNDNVFRLDIAFKRGHVHRDLYSRISDAITFHDLYSKSKYLDPLSNKVCIFTSFLTCLPPNQSKIDLPIKERMSSLIDSIVLSSIVPSSKISILNVDRVLSFYESTYSYCVSTFIQHFSGSVGPYVSTVDNMAKNNQVSQSELHEIKSKLKIQPYTPLQIYTAISNNPEIVKMLYKHFEILHNPKLQSQDENVKGMENPVLTGKLSKGSSGMDNSVKPNLVNDNSVESSSPENGSPENVIESDRDFDSSTEYSYSTVPMRGKSVLEAESLAKKIIRTIKQLENLEEIDILLYFIKFNNHTLRTNFFVPNKISLSFRFNCGFLSKLDYPKVPYGIALIIGPHFMGFHIRFSEISRGGVRVVQSFSEEAYTRNKLQIFDEAYNLSFTQSLKNKDIPEGGSKGVILLEKTSTKYKADLYTRTSFMCYIDGILDLILPNKHIVDLLGKDDIYFLGPDEFTGTGGLMDWASQYAKFKGLKYWRSFTTGKAPQLGGIPHDIYGMTTTSIEAYVTGILNKYGLKEEEVTRFLTGGPDGDLGSNAIKVSNTKTLTVLDKSGVLHDPNGLDLNELRRLAFLRDTTHLSATDNPNNVTLNHSNSSLQRSSSLEGDEELLGARLKTCSMGYDKRLLSSKGFMVPEEAMNVVLPDGFVVKNGYKFRDEFHLSSYAKADLFCPCGGRPSSITPFNVNRLFDEKGKCRFKFIVEGSNVYITQNARRFLESKGVILFKDASTNKGGVTSSSYEVLLSLVLDDETYERVAVERDGNVPEFRKKYVNDIMEIIRKNATLEFEALWSEGLRTGIPRCDLTDVLSDKINALKSRIKSSNTLFNDKELVHTVLSRCVPASLLELVTVEKIVERLPQIYLRALFASYIASNFYYKEKFSDDTSVFAFYEYITSLKDPAGHKNHYEEFSDDSPFSTMGLKLTNHV